MTVEQVRRVLWTDHPATHKSREDWLEAAG